MNLLADEQTRATHHIKMRKAGAKQWAFLTPRACTNRLRIHAAMFTEEAASEFVAKHRPLNPEWEFKVCPIAS